jgi:Tfp pilus assembly protein PilF
MPCRSLSLLIMCCVVPLTASAGETPWTEIRSPHFRVLTNGSVEDARKVAYEFEQLRYVFATRFPNARLESGAPFLIFATRDEKTARQLESSEMKRTGGELAGEFRSGFERQYALVRLDTFAGNGAREVAYHEYTHRILHLNLHWLPAWLDEGTAEFYAYTRIEKDQIYLGSPTERSKLLHTYQVDRVEDIMAGRYFSGLYSQFFYAESWALVHFLIYGPGMEGGKKLDQFVSLLQQGVKQQKAFEQVFGDLKKVDGEFAGYARWEPSDLGQTFAATRLRNVPHIDTEQFSVRTMSMAETEADLGGYHLWRRDSVGARSLIEQALKDEPKLGLAHENLGFLDFAEGKDADAAREFAQAYSLDGNLYLSLFYKTMLSPLATANSVAEVNACGATMGKVLHLNPDFAPAYVQLAKLALREGDLISAWQLSKKTEELEPSLAGYHLLTGEVLKRMGKGADAGAYAKFVADRWIGPDHDEAVELWNSLPVADRPALEPVSETDLVDAEKGTQVAEGRIKSVACGDQDKEGSFVLDHDGNSLTFHRKAGAFSAGFSDTLWYGGDHFNLCHHLEGMRAVIRYRSASDASYAGDIMEIGIRDDLPEPVSTASAPAKDKE